MHGAGATVNGRSGRATVRLALKGLAEEGLIVSQRGRGTFVLERLRDRAAGQAAANACGGRGRA